MNYHVFSEQPSYPLCILVPFINTKEIVEAYLTPFGISEDDVLILSLHQSKDKKKTPVGEMKEYIQSELQPVLVDMGVQHILCADSEYFKVFTKSGKADAKLGYVCDSEFGNQKINYVPNYRAIFYDPPKVLNKIGIAINSMISFLQDDYTDPGHGIIKLAEYPGTATAISEWLQKLLEMNCPLTVDIETFSLKHPTAGIGTITFCWNKHEGIAFPVDCLVGSNTEVRKELKAFFRANKQKLIYHNISFDVYILIYQLFMDGILDMKGMLEGLSVMLRDFDDTKIITYLATNSCAGNKLGLKDQAQEFAGDYANENIIDITKIALDELLTYNLVDGLSTWYVHEKYYQKMVNDDQLDIYENLFKPALKDIIQMQLTGLPIHMPSVLAVEEALTGVYKDAIERIENTKCVQEFQYYLKEKYIEKMHAKWKKKRITLAEVPEDERFNPRSPLQLQKLLYDQLGLPVLSLTDTKQPSCDGDTIELLLNHTTNPDVLELLHALMDFAAVGKIITSFLPAFKNATPASDGWWYLFGNFVLGGTVSGRLSSNSPNLQNLPANVTMKISDTLLEMFPLLKSFLVKGKLSLGKLIKFCFKAPPGWIFCGLDFASLEDRISALTTKDPNKLKLYIDGYDGHCLRAFYYFGEQMPEVQVAPLGAECYTANVGGTDIFFHSEEDVEYLGKQMKGKELYELLTSQGL